MPSATVSGLKQQIRQARNTDSLNQLPGDYYQTVLQQCSGEGEISDLARQLYMIRRRKILSRVPEHIPREKLTTEEQELAERIQGLVDEAKTDLREQLTLEEVPSEDDFTDSTEPQQTGQLTEQRVSSLQSLNSGVDRAMAPDTEPADNSGHSYAVVLITSDLGADDGKAVIAGIDGSEYPVTPGDVVRLPSQNAAPIVERGGGIKIAEEQPPHSEDIQHSTSEATDTTLG